MSTNTVDLPASACDRMTRREAAQYLGVEECTLAAWASSGRYGLKYSRVGRIAVYRRADLDSWLAARTGTSAAQISASLSE